MTAHLGKGESWVLLPRHALWEQKEWFVFVAGIIDKAVLFCSNLKSPLRIFLLKKLVKLLTQKTE